MTTAMALTRRGRGVVLSGCALVLAGWLTDIRAALAAGVFALAVAGSALAWVSIRRHSVLIGRMAPPQTSAVGSELPTIAAIEVGRLGFGPALVRNVIPEQTDSPGGDGGAIVVRLGRSRALVERTWVPQRRGLLHWPQLVVELPDPLGMAVGMRLSPVSGRTVVFPRTVPLGQGVPGAAAGDLDAGPARPGRPGDPGSVPREYHRGDELRRMHWPATARAGRPMVRTEEPRSARTAVIAIDCSPAGYRDPEAFERAITACASIAEALLDQGWSVHVRTAQGRPLTDPPGLLGAEGRHRVLAALAVLQLDSPGALVAPQPAGSGDAAIVVHGARSGDIGQSAISLCTDVQGEFPGTLVWDGSAPLSTVWAGATSQGAVA